MSKKCYEKDSSGLYYKNITDSVIS